MTYLLFFFICLKTIYLSKGDCVEYFEIAEWKNNLTENISLVDTRDPRDQIECSVERICLEKGKLCDVRHHCFDVSTTETNPDQITEKCKGNTSTKIYFYNFMCLTAKAANIKKPVEGCDDYETICSIKTPVFLDQTTLPPTTAAPTTQPKRTTALPLTTTTTTTTVKPMTTTQATSNVSQNADGNFHGRIATSNSTDNSAWKLPFLFSMSLNCVLLVVCLIMWYQMMRSSKDSDETSAVNDSEGRMEEGASHPQAAGNEVDLKLLPQTPNPEQEISNQTRTSPKDSHLQI